MGRARVTPRPLLRAPPFPGIAPDIAAVAGATVAVNPSDEEVEAAIALVRAARVGGAFWAPPGEAGAGEIVRAQRTRACAADPWSVLAPHRALAAHGDDEWAAVATIMGAELSLLSGGRFGAPGETSRALRRRVATELLGRAYRDPFTGASATLAQAVELLAFWRGVIDANRPIVAAAGMAWWKRDAIRRLLWAPRAHPMRFLGPAAAIRRARRAGGAVAVWPSRVPGALLADARARGAAVMEVEDGFVRSAGLGVELAPPMSVCVDRSGIHYDPSRASDLETLLARAEVGPALLARAARLRGAIVAGGVSKYGAAAAAPLPPRNGRRLVLVPGQVEDDRSVLLGGGGLGNLGLLARARAAEPDAELWFRPHPDVDAGHRKGGVPDEAALAHADRVVRGGSIADLLREVDAVHVLTSLTGFEALLRGRDVVCHGVPFFAGWGLTRDLAPIPDRRGRPRTLDELVAITMILYPRYLDPVTRLPCPAEVLVSRMTGAPARATGWVAMLRRAQGWAVKELSRCPPLSNRSRNTISRAPTHLRP